MEQFVVKTSLKDQGAKQLRFIMIIINKIVTLIIAGMNPLYQVYIDIVLLVLLKFMA